MEPYRFRKWKVTVASNKVAYFFTCARPGRSKYQNEDVPDSEVSNWVCRLVDRLPGCDISIVSLLGRKGGSEGPSEFLYYSFCGEFDTPSERRNQPTFQEWLDQRHEALEINVREHPTYDYLRIPLVKLEPIAEDILDLMSSGRTVVVVDSGGEQRTRKVCEYINAVEDSRA